MPENSNTLQNHLNDDLQFLIACCQTEPSEDDINFIRSFINNSKFNIAPSGNALGVQDLLVLANTHGIIPLVYKTLTKINEDELPSSSLNTYLPELKSAYMAIAQRNMLMTSELIRIMKLLKENSIEVLAFKGPALAQNIYEDITLRQYGDLDILIKQEDINQVEKLCLSIGYTLHYTLTDTQRKSWYKHAKDMVFFHPEKKSYLEIHWLLLDADYPIHINLDNIWKQTHSIEINKYPIPTFSSESLLLYLCIHGSKHLWERISWIKDIDLMIRTQTIDLEKIILDSEKNDSKRMLFLGLYLSKMLFKTTMPEDIERLLEKEKMLAELSSDVFMHWKTPLSMSQNTKVMLKFFPTLKMKARYLHKVILKPSHNEYRFIDLPKGFHWVYYLTRPYLLGKKYLTKN